MLVFPVVPAAPSVLPAPAVLAVPLDLADLLLQWALLHLLALVVPSGLRALPRRHREPQLSA